MKEFGRVAREGQRSSEAFMPVAAPVERFWFAGFRLEVRTRQLFRDNVRVPITTKAFDTLLALVQRSGEVVTKEELITQVWPTTVVTEDSLTQNISVLRRLLEDDSAQPRFIATVARHGYRFIAKVTGDLDNPVAEPSSKPPVNPDSAAAQHVHALLGEIVHPAPADPAPADAVPAALAISAAPADPRRWRASWILAALVLVVGGIGLGVLLHTNSNPDALVGRRLRFTPELPPDIALASGGVVSPDGRRVAVIGRERQSGETRLWIRTLSTGAVTAVPESNGAVRPFWSPDGKAIAFFAGGRLLRSGVAGGEPSLICLTVAPRPAGATWGSRGEILFADRGGIFLVPAVGGQPTIALKPDFAHKEFSIDWPQFFPGGRSFMYEVVSSEPGASGIYAGSLDQPLRKKLLDAQGDQVAYARGHLIYIRDGRLFARAFNSKGFDFTGDPIVVVDTTSPDAVVSAGDSVIAFGGGASEEIAQYDRQGRILRTITGLPPLRNLTLSPDQRFLIGESTDSNRSSSGAWLIDVARGVHTRFVEDSTVYPLWLPDGRTVAYAAAREPGFIGLYLRNMQSGTERLLLRTRNLPFVSSASPDGQTIAFTMIDNEKTRQDIWIVNQHDPTKPVRLLGSEAREIQPAISPNGQWIAYVSDEEGSFDVYVDAFPGLGQKQRVSTNGGTQPQWRADGRELFYLNDDQTIMSVGVASTHDPQLTPPRALFQPKLIGLTSDYRNQYTVSPDGQTFFVDVAAQSDGQEPMNLIVNWRAPAD